MRDNLLQLLFVIGKVFEIGLTHILSSKIDNIMKGYGLSILSILSKECAIKDQPNYESWLLSLTLKGEVDCDLLYLLDPTIGTSWNPYNIHIHPCSSEIIESESPLRHMLQSVVDLVVCFPGNELLLNICKISSHITQFSIHEPVGKILQSVQLLLKAAQEWEQYAAKHVSLSESMSGLTLLITRWRTLELNS